MIFIKEHHCVLSLPQPLNHNENQHGAKKKIARERRREREREKQHKHINKTVSGKFYRLFKAYVIALLKQIDFVCELFPLTKGIKFKLDWKGRILKDLSKGISQASKMLSRDFTFGPTTGPPK